MVVNTKLNNKIIDLQLEHSIDDSNYYIRQYNNLIDIYKRRLELLESNKPFSFQKKKINEYNKLVEDQTIMIQNLTAKAEDEIDFISDIRNKVIHIDMEG